LLRYGVSAACLADAFKCMKTYIVDSFTDTPFKGNPAGVCILESDLTDQVMLHIAQELNLSETAFIRRSDIEDEFSIRFFSPKMEISLCGHATLASARVVFEVYGLDHVSFKNAQGLSLKATMWSDRVAMLFPKYDTTPSEAPPDLLAVLGISLIQNSAYNDETKILLLEIADPNELVKLAPNFAELVRSHSGINGVLVTAPSGNDGYDFHSRYFWPWSGSDEDPVTGATHTFLAPYWSQRLGKTTMKSYQSSARSGFMDVELIKDKVQISSQAVIVFRGHLVR
jgi:PhzF family phenazine biosynthesis protein